MKSIQHINKKCPKCNSCFNDYHCNNGEEYFNCYNKDCSFSYKIEFKKNKDGDISKKYDKLSDTINSIKIETVWENNKKIVRKL